MAQEGSVASSSPTPNWWENIAMNHRWQPQSNSFNCEDQEMMSNISYINHSGLGMDLSSVQLSIEPPDNQLLSQVLYGVENTATELFNPECDYLKKCDSSWEFTNHTQVANLESSYNNGTTIEPNWLTNLSDLVTWSIAPPITTTSNPSQFSCELPTPFSSTDELVGINNKFLDLLSFDTKTCVKGSESSTKQGHESSSSTKGKRSEESSETVLSKKSKQETSNDSSVKIQPTKVKLQEKISALQQIVSPFGKTDTASVLMEAFNYIGFLHEQVQLLSDPYMKSGGDKDYNSEAKNDLRSRGLCLAPVSCTPQVYRENTGPDCWLTYRGCLFR